MNTLLFKWRIINLKRILDTKYLKIALYTIFVIIISILAYRLSSKSDNIMPAISSFFSSIIGMLSPILYGLLIAYLMNPAMGFFERHLIKMYKMPTLKHYKFIRILSIIIVYICLFGTVILATQFLIPQMLENIKVLITNLPTYIDAFQGFINTLETNLNNNLASLPISVDTSILFDSLEINSMFNIEAIKLVLDTLISNTLNITNLLLDWVIGFVVALYALNQKETFVNGSKRLTYALVKRTNAEKIIQLVGETNNMIIKFFVGKSLDSLIIGILCYLGLNFVLHNPYALLLALIVGVCNMIPYFGPFIGAVPAVAITLFEGLPAALGVAIFILILQQFDGLILGPKILGDSIGISPFWIISAITIGGALWGPLGMFFASPILAVILSTSNRWIDKKLRAKDIDLPQLSSNNFTPCITEPTTKFKIPKLNTSSKKNNDPKA